MGGGELSIGVVLPLTGRRTDSFGIPMSQDFELARNEMNNAQPSAAKLNFIIVDDRSAIEGSVEAFKKLIHQEGVSVILGPATSSQAREGFQVAQENQILAISQTSAARSLRAIGNFVSRIALTTDVLIPSGIEVTRAKLAYQQVDTIYDETDLFSTDGYEAAREVLTDRGIEVLTTETFKGSDTEPS